MKREAEGNNNDDSISISSSRSSLASWDLALRQSFHKHVSILFFHVIVIKDIDIEMYHLVKQ